MERSQNYQIVTFNAEGSIKPVRYLEEDLTTLHWYDIEGENCHDMESDPEHGAIFMAFANIRDDEGILSFARKYGLLVPLRRKPSVWERHRDSNPNGPPLILPDYPEHGEYDPRFPDWEYPRPHNSEGARTRAGVNDTRVLEPLRFWHERIAIMQSIVNAQSDRTRALLFSMETRQMAARRVVFLKDGRLAWRWRYFTLWDAMLNLMIDCLSDYRMVTCANERCLRTFMTAHSRRKYCSRGCQDAQKSRRYRNRQAKED